MILSEFEIRNGSFVSFSVRGHAGLAEAPHDILCAAVSSMTQLVANTLTECFQAELDLTVREEIPQFDCRVLRVPAAYEKASDGVIRGLYLQMQDLAVQYPDHIRVTKKS